MMTNDVSQGRLRPVGNSVRKPWSLAVATMLYVLSVLVASCRGSESSAVFTEAQRHEADSVVKSCAGIDSLKVLLEKAKSEKGWEFLFLAANIDAAESAGSIGIEEDCAMPYIPR